MRCLIGPRASTEAGRPVRRMRGWRACRGALSGALSLLAVALTTSARADSLQWSAAPGPDSTYDMVDDDLTMISSTSWRNCLDWDHNPDLSIKECSNAIIQLRMSPLWHHKIRTSSENLSITLAARGAAYGKKGNYQKALADLNEAISFDPRNARAFVNRGVVHARLGDLAAARRDFEAALRLQPENPVARGDLAGLEA